MSTRPKSIKAAPKTAATKKAPMSKGNDKPVAAKSARFDLSPILEALRKRVPKARAAEAEAFARGFYKRMLEEIAQQKTLDYPTASVAVQRLSQLASRG